MKKGDTGETSTLTDLKFEDRVDFHSIRKKPGKAERGLFFENGPIARCLRKHDFYEFLSESKIDRQKVAFKKTFTDNAFFVRICLCNIFNELPLAWLGLPTKKG